MKRVSASETFVSLSSHHSVTRSSFSSEEGNVRRNLFSFGVSHALDHEVSMDASENVQSLTLVPMMEVISSETFCSSLTMILTRGNV